MAARTLQRATLRGRYPTLATTSYSTRRSTELREDFGSSASSLRIAPLPEHELPAKRLTEIKAALKSSVTRARAWPPEAEGWDCIAAGLRATYQRARRALRHARADRATEDLHEWRKQTKYLWHQLQILTPLAAGSVGELADEFHHLADYLGDEHDLAVLRERVAAPALKTLIDRRREELQDKALTLGERLYSDKSKAFVHRHAEGLARHLTAISAPSRCHPWQLRSAAALHNDPGVKRCARYWGCPLLLPF